MAMMHAVMFLVVLCAHDAFVPITMIEHSPPTMEAPPLRKSELLSIMIRAPPASRHIAQNGQ
jgi:hypothetical protein